jgi:glycine oxidase
MAALRPGSPDNAPIIGASAVDRLIVATGHYRNGVLLTPITADLVAATATHTESERDRELLAVTTPRRFDRSTALMQTPA